MEGTSANILFRQSWNNLVDLPSTLASLLYNANVSPQEVIVELVLQSHQKSYVGWSGMNSKVGRTIGIDPLFAHSLLLADSQLVVVNIKIRNFKASNIFLEPESFTDWELVELHAAYIESKLIEQSRCLAVNQVLVVYPTRTSSVRLVVRDIGSTTHTYGLIDPFAEISISPKQKEKKKVSGSRSNKSARSSRSSLEDSASGPSLLKRGISLPNLTFPEVPSSHKNSYEIYIAANDGMLAFPKTDFVSVSIIPGPNSKSNKAPTDNANTSKSKEANEESISRVVENKHVVAKLIRVPTGPPNCVGLSEKLAISLNVENTVGYKVILEQANKNVSRRPSTFMIYPYTIHTKKSEGINLNSNSIKQQQAALAQKISNALFKQQSLLTSPITNFSKISILPGLLPHGGILAFKRNDDHRAWVKPYIPGESGNPPRIEIGDEILRSSSFIQDVSSEEHLERIYGVKSTFEEIVSDIRTFRNSGIMLYGNSSCGKTLMLKSISRSLKKHHGFFTKYVPCETIMNENLEQLCNHIKLWFNEAVWNEPSVLILDNLDKLLPAELEHTDASQSNQLTELLVSLMLKTASQKTTNVSLLVSGASKESFNKHLALSHLIDQFHQLSAPNKATRRLILEEYLVKRLGCVLNFDIMDIVLDTEGYLPNDIRILCDRIYYESLHQNQLHSEMKSSGVCQIQKSDVAHALAGYQPSNLRGVKLEKSSTTWSEIGGLQDAKRVLLETLEWPTKYAPIFAGCPLRLRSGVLLYGYPGCGKTLLASVIASQCGLNFISIKGPEILNKYIGASEQSVRELFDRAQAAKPCILFFDEFDSIAPKRGHDSTGVTDRVVNQMLTQMDGAEGLDGVYVLAATSRPDLIDSALLRPGRLDKSIICDMPNYEDRLDILNCICSKMDLHQDVNIETIARDSEGFSGADLQGLGYNAYLKGVHEILAEQEVLDENDEKESSKLHEFFRVKTGKSSGFSIKPAEKAALQQQIEQLFHNQNGMENKTSSKSDRPTVVICQKHLLESLKETKPSISASEKAKLDRIYSEFVTARDGNMPDGAASNNIGGRTTLM